MVKSFWKLGFEVVQPSLKSEVPSLSRSGQPSRSTVEVPEAHGQSSTESSIPSPSASAAFVANGRKTTSIINATKINPRRFARFEPEAIVTPTLSVIRGCGVFVRTNLPKTGERLNVNGPTDQHGRRVAKGERRGVRPRIVASLAT